MGQIQIPKQLQVQDFDASQQKLIAKIGYIYNDFALSVYHLLQKGIDFTNLNRDLIVVQINIDSAGKLINPPQIAFNLQDNPKGVVCVSATNMTNITVYPVSAPFISWSINSNGKLLLNHVTGLQASSKYSLTLELIG
jgi:hypothetical protein